MPCAKRQIDLASLPPLCATTIRKGASLCGAFLRGIRMFRKSNFEWLQVICCMKKAGISIKDIRLYIELAMQGDDTIDARLEMFRQQREVLTQQIRLLHMLPAEKRRPPF